MEFHPWGERTNVAICTVADAAIRTKINAAFSTRSAQTPRDGHDGI